MKKELLLGIDLGSGELKLTLLAPDGRIVGSVKQEYPTVYCGMGGAEQRPGQWGQAMKLALEHLFEKTGLTSASIAAIAPDAATHTAVLLDGENRPLRNAILWTDQRSRLEVEQLRRDKAQLLQEKTLNTPSPVWTLPQLMWLQKTEPEVLQKTEKLLFEKDFLRWQLTGKMATDEIDAAGSMFFDVTKGKWDKELCDLAGIWLSACPELQRPEEQAGCVTEEAAKEFGLLAGTPVYTGSTDTVMEQLAAGNIHEGDCSVKLATAGRICVLCKTPQYSPYLFNYRHVVPGLWYPGTATGSCASSYRWFRDRFGKEEGFAGLNEQAAGVRLGSDGLMFHPYLQGELTPYNDAELCGSFTGLRTLHTKGHFARAIMEGVCFSLLDCVHTLKEMQMEPRTLRVIGGGSGSIYWRQILADVLGKDLEKPESGDSSLGSAMLAGVGCGLFSDYEAAVKASIRTEAFTAHDPEHTAQYETYYKRYRAIADAMQNIYHQYPV